MAKIENADASFYMNPAAYTQAKTERADEKKLKSMRRDNTKFSRLFDDLRGKTAEKK